MKPFPFVLCAALVAGAAFAACSAQLEPENALSPTDPLYGKAQAACGSDAIIARVVDMENDEALCCLTVENLVPKSHCFTASGAVVTNPNSISKLKAVAAAQDPN